MALSGVATQSQTLHDNFLSEGALTYGIESALRAISRASKQPYTVHCEDQEKRLSNNYRTDLTLETTIDNNRSSCWNSKGSDPMHSICLPSYRPWDGIKNVATVLQEYGKPVSQSIACSKDP
jgi:hypothetical protein